MFTPELYRRWMKSFSLIDNPLVAYLDNDDDIRYFEGVRKTVPKHRTRIVKIHRKSLWAFKIEPQIRAVFSQSSYPKYLPNTVVSEYSAAMHAKYELVQRTIQENPFKTKYICWLDIGLFRTLTDENKPDVPSEVRLGRHFSLTLPPNFDASKVAYTEVHPMYKFENARQIIYSNSVWVCGAYFVGTLDVVSRWAYEYVKYTEQMLGEHLMSTDQQIIYWIFTNLNPVTNIQTYRGNGTFDKWFHLGFISRRYSDQGGLSAR